MSVVSWKGQRNHNKLFQDRISAFTWTDQEKLCYQLKPQYSVSLL